MIEHPAKQGSDEWAEARLGIPTASQFGRLVAPRTKKISAGIGKYVHELLAEWALGFAAEPPPGEWMDRGTLLESEAAVYYDFQRGVTSRAAGLITTDDGLVGCSPDRIVDADGALSAGGVEIKCASPKVHLAYLLDDDSWKAHFAQIQGCMFVTGTFWWDFVAYHPSLPSRLVRVDKDEEYHASLVEALATLQELLAKGKEELIDRGLVRRVYPDSKYGGERRGAV